MIVRIALRRLAPVALLATVACFATRSDVRILQEDVQQVRTDMAAADAAQNQQMARLSDQLATLVDSVRVVSERMAGWQPNVLATLRNIQEQLLQVPEHHIPFFWVRITQGFGILDSFFCEYRNYVTQLVRRHADISGRK